MATKTLDANQVIKKVYNPANERLRVEAEITATFSEAEVIISHEDDSIRLGDGASLVTTTTVNGKVGLDVSVITTKSLTGSFKSTSVTVGPTPTLIPATNKVGRKVLSARVWNGPTIYLGGSDVTPSNGYPKRRYEEIVGNIEDDVLLYGVTISGTSDVRTLEK